MKFKSRLLFTTFLIVLFLQSHIYSQTDKNSMGLAEYYTAIQNSVTIANAQLETNKTKWKITDIKINLKGVKIDKIGGSIKIIFFRVGGNNTRDETTELTLNLTTPKSKSSALSNPDNEKIKSIKDQVAEIVTYLRKTCESIDNGNTFNPYVIYPDTLVLKVAHTLSRGKNNGIDFTFWDDMIEIKGGDEDSSRSFVQTIEFTCVKEKPKEAVVKKAPSASDGVIKN